MFLKHWIVLQLQYRKLRVDYLLDALAWNVKFLVDVRPCVLGRAYSFVACPSNFSLLYGSNWSDPVRFGLTRYSLELAFVLCQLNLNFADVSYQSLVSVSPSQGLYVSMLIVEYAQFRQVDANFFVCESWIWMVSVCVTRMQIPKKWEWMLKKVKWMIPGVLLNRHDVVIILVDVV